MFRIGEFSKVAQVSGRLLRYYDQIGLFSPEHTDPNSGYRFYSAHQLSQLNRILVMKELGLSLEQIKQLIARDIATDEIRSMLLRKKAQVEQVVQDELSRLHYLESRLKELNDDKRRSPDVVLKAIPAQRYLSTREVFPSLKAIHQRVATIYQTIHTQIDKKYLSYIMLIIHSAIFDSDSLDVEIGSLVDERVCHALTLPDACTLNITDLAPVDLMATAIHTGGLADIHLTYQALGTWIEDNQYQILGLGREVFIELPRKGFEDDVVAEIQMPVLKLAS